MKFWPNSSSRAAKQLRNNTSGFTLMEILLVVLMFGFLGTIAIRAYFNSAQNFQYLESYKEIVSMFRDARSMAITNRVVQTADDNGTEVPDNFGIYIDVEEKQLILFADNGFESSGGDNVYHSQEYDDTEGANDFPDRIIKQFDFGHTNYELEILDSDGAEFVVADDDPNTDDIATIFYPTGQFSSARVCMEDCSTENDTLSTVFKFTDPSGGIERYMVLIHFTGNIEETKSYNAVASP